VYRTGQYRALDDADWWCVGEKYYYVPRPIEAAIAAEASAAVTAERDRWKQHAQALLAAGEVDGRTELVRQRDEALAASEEMKQILRDTFDFRHMGITLGRNTVDLVQRAYAALNPPASTAAEETPSAPSIPGDDQ
jgi:hypothetical protein